MLEQSEHLRLTADACCTLDALNIMKLLSNYQDTQEEKVGIWDGEVPCLKLLKKHR